MAAWREDLDRPLAAYQYPFAFIISTSNAFDSFVVFLIFFSYGTYFDAIRYKIYFCYLRLLAFKICWQNFCFFHCFESNQIFHYTGCVTSKRATSMRGSSPRHCARVTQLLSEKCCCVGEPMAKLCRVWPPWGLNIRSPAPKTNARYRSTVFDFSFYWWLT